MMPKKKKAVGKSWHETCFKCKQCNKQLESVSLASHEDEIFCQACYNKLYGAKGFRGGAGAIASSDVGETQEEVVSGLDEQIKQKQASKYDSKLEDKARAYIEKKTGKKLEGTLQEALKDGVILADLANSIQSGLVTGVKHATLAFKQMENIGKFLSALPSLGIKVTDSFMTVDLYEGKNIPLVIDTILVLASKHP